MHKKLDFEGRQRVCVLVEQIGDDLDEYAWRIVEQETEIERLRGLLFDVLATKQMPMWLRVEIKDALNPDAAA